MSDVKITKDVYKQYAKKIATVLENEEFYEQFKKRVDSGASSFKLGKKRLIQDISIDWIDTIEEILPNLDTIVRNPRRFIVQEEDIVDVSLARSISTESVKFLAQHTNMISKVEDDGSVIPSKILNITKEESFEIYENRFIYTLLLKLKDFVTMRYDKIKKASATQDVLELDVESRFNLPSKKITFRTEYFAQLSFDEVMRLDPDTLTKIERVAKIDRIITDFLSSSFAKSMRNSAPVRPPIMRTNVILKEPNFKKALVLWQFIETYNQTAGFSTSDDVEELELESTSIENLRHMITLNTMLFESMYEDYERDMDMEDKEFGDFLRVGDMDFQKDELDRDEYAQKLEDRKENDEEEQNIEEVRPEEQPDAEHEIPPEQPPEQEPVETPPDEKQIVQEKEVERPVEVERFKEMAPKADQEEVDLEPDAVKFDQHLFEVRKLYKRPDDDRLKQEDIVKVRDAIDRCLTSYRRIKQEELDELERQDRIRRRREDMQKRAVAFNKQREELSKSVDSMQSTDIFFGMDPFSYQKAKLAAEKLEEERLEKLKLNKDEKLELEGDQDKIEQEILDMEAAKAEQQDDLAETDQPIAEQPEVVDEALSDQTEEAEQPVEEQRLPAKRGLRLAKGDEEVDPWAAKPSKPAKDIEKVDESKVAVGGITFKDGTNVDDPFGGPSGITSNRAEVRREEPEPAPKPEQSDKPKRPRKKKKPADKPLDNSEQPVDALPAEKEAEPQTATDPEPVKDEALQNVSEAQDAPAKDIEKVDESKVAVGGITFKDGTNVDDPFGGPSGITSNRAEVRREEPEPAPKPEQSDKPKRPRKKKKPADKPLDNSEQPVDALPAEKEAEPQTATDPEPVKDEALQNVSEAQDAPANESDEQPQAESDIAPAEQPEEHADDAPQDDEATPAEAPAEDSKQDDVAPQPAKPKRPRKKKGELSHTTVNQKYSKPTGRKLNLSAVDEDKVGIGGITFKDGSGIFDPFALAPISDLSNKAEDSSEDQD